MTDQKVALVTGSGKRRVGWHVAAALAGREYAVVIHYHRSATEAAQTVSYLQDRGTEAVAYQADLRDASAVRALVDQAIGRFGRLDVLVNCAAMWERKKLEEVRADDVRNNWEVNTLGTFLCTQQAGLAMVRQPEGGNIILLGDWATRRPYLHYSAYFASKGSIATLTRCFAVELGNRNPRVRVNCIQPGPVMLPPDLSPEERQQALRGTLVKREGGPDSISKAVLALLDNDFITGVCLPVDGGRSIYAPE
jgi:pteridine reductase